MKAIRFVITTLCTLSVSLASTVWATADASSGRIEFSGTIVEEPCDVRKNNVSDKLLDVSCWQKGEETLQSVSLINSSTYRSSSGSKIHVDVEYLNAEKTLAIVNMTYN